MPPFPEMSWQFSNTSTHGFVPTREKPGKGKPLFSFEASHDGDGVFHSGEVSLHRSWHTLPNKDLKVLVEVPMVPKSKSLAGPPAWLHSCCTKVLLPMPGPPLTNRIVPGTRFLPKASRSFFLGIKMAASNGAWSFSLFLQVERWPFHNLKEIIPAFYEKIKMIRNHGCRYSCIFIVLLSYVCSCRYLLRPSISSYFEQFKGAGLYNLKATPSFR